MKNRKSLHQKLEYCVQHGTLQTFSEEEAFVKCFDLNPDYQERESQKVTKAYSEGKVLCRFEFFDPDEFSVVSQLNTPSKFITDIIYIILTETS